MIIIIRWLKANNRYRNHNYNTLIKESIFNSVTISGDRGPHFLNLSALELRGISLISLNPKIGFAKFLTNYGCFVKDQTINFRI